MTVIFHDIHEIIRGNLIQHRTPGATFDEVMYADDTICTSPDTRTINKFIETIETVGEQYGLKLNNGKCEVLTTERDPNIKFKNQTKINRKTQVTYLGCELNMEGNMNRELNKRIASTMLTLKRLDIYWRHSNCPVRTKLITADAVIRAKVLYGLDSAQLNEPHLKRLDVFQLKIFRKILKLKTTYIDRSNTNQKKQEQINKEIQKDKQKTITTFRDAYFKSKRNRLAKIITHKGENTNNILFRDPENLKPGERVTTERTKGARHWEKESQESE